MVIKTRIKDTNNTATAQVRIKELNFDFAFDEVNLISATRTHFVKQIIVVNNIQKQHFIACNAIRNRIEILILKNYVLRYN